MRQLKISQKITSRESEGLEKYLLEVGRIPMLTPEEEVSLTKKIKSGDDNALKQMVNSNLRFVVSVAKQYQNNGLSLNDLINEGNVGLLKAAKRFDETKGFKFITYAVWWIRQSILQAIVENSRMIRLPYNKVNIITQLNSAQQKFIQQYEREPTVAEMADMMDMSEEEMAVILTSNTRHSSLDEPINSMDQETVRLEILIDENQESPESILMDESVKDEIRYALNHLSPTERTIIKMSFGIDNQRSESLENIASHIGMSHERTRQLKEHAFRRLRKIIKPTQIY
ncbi:MAG: RNA polymerase sigma factor RpoD/SigA [Saprospiraceae bacterium]|nr:RNA polymerase sigma factor RpoD/SigA [Saprospiraceae bacterium]